MARFLADDESHFRFVVELLREARANDGLTRCRERRLTAHEKRRIFGLRVTTFRRVGRIIQTETENLAGTPYRQI